MKIDIGISEDQRKEIAEGLSHLLADSYTLYLKTHNFHWNVTGPMFVSLHQLFEQHYTELAIAVDEIAERIRSLGFFVPGSFKRFQELTSVIQEEEVPSAEEMIRSAVTAHETVIRTARGILETAERGNDQPTIDLLTRRMETHEKTAWMLRSLLEKRPVEETI
jgi:starvation-inducible DNA-binding protein